LVMLHLLADLQLVQESPMLNQMAAMLSLPELVMLNPLVHLEVSSRCKFLLDVIHASAKRSEALR